MAAEFDYPSGDARRARARLFFSAALAVGIAAAVLAIELASLPTKFIVTGVAGAAALAIAAAMFGTVWWDRLLLVVLVFSIPFHLDKNFFYRVHVGGATSVAVSVTDLALLAILVTRLSQTFANRALRSAGRRLEWRILGPAFAYMLCGVLSVLNADYPSYVWFEEIRLAKLVTVMWIIMSLRSHAEIRVMLVALAVTVVAQGALAGYQYGFNSTIGLGIFGETFGETGTVEQNIGFIVSRAGGTLGHPNLLGYFLEMATPLMLALCLIERNTALRGLHFLAFCAGIGGLAVTLSRGAWLSLPVSLGLVLTTLGLPHLRRLKGIVVLCMILLFATAALTPVYPMIEKRFTHDDYKSAASRMPLNRAAWSIVKQHPVVGVGLNNFSEVFKKYDTTGHSRIFRGYKQVVHNLYLWVWAEVGTLGLIAFLAMFGGAFSVAWWLFQRGQAWPRGVAIGASAGLAGHLVHGLVDPGFKVMMNTSVLVFLLLGMIAALRLIEDRASLPPLGARPGDGAVEHTPGGRLRQARIASSRPHVTDSRGNGN